MFYRLRQYIRKKMPPIKSEVAWAWKTNFSIAYALIGWNLLGVCVYLALKDKVGKNNQSKDYAKLLGVTNAHVIKYSNLQKVEDYEINLTDEDVEDYHRKLKERGKQRIEGIEPSDGFWNRRWVDSVNKTA